MGLLVAGCLGVYTQHSIAHHLLHRRLQVSGYIAGRGAALLPPAMPLFCSFFALNQSYLYCKHLSVYIHRTNIYINWYKYHINAMHAYISRTFQNCVISSSFGTKPHHKHFFESVRFKKISHKNKIVHTVNDDVSTWSGESFSNEQPDHVLIVGVFVCKWRTETVSKRNCVY